ncbi:hypothetical protein [Rhodococcus pyridinivorans]|uniref:hypothetical protein n=1 Tax=Rhodococcus pyridinivorans TaxID=103816 RepID=UPI001365A821|nr:hypothetical protein [Rhodococcus pyridinivorans]
MTRRPFRRVFAVGGISLALLAALPGTASAHHQEFVPLPTTYSLGRDHTVACSGQLTGHVFTPHDRPGTIVVDLSWSTFFGGSCTITAFVNHRGSKRSGVRALELTSAPGEPGHAPSGQVTIDIGSGDAGMTVTTDALNTTYLDPARFTTRFLVP